MLNIRVEEEKDVPQGACCPLRMKMRKKFGAPEKISCPAPEGRAFLQVSEWDEARMGHDIYRRVEADRGNGMEKIPLPDKEYLDEYRLAGAFSHYPFNANADALVLPRCSYKEVGLILYTYTGQAWMEKERLPWATEFFGLSDQDKFVFFEPEKCCLVLIDSHTFEKSTVDLLKVRFLNAHLSDDRTQALVVGVQDTSTIFQLCDFKTSQSVPLQSGENSVDAKLKVGDCQFKFPCDKEKNIVPIWGENHFSIQIRS